MVKAPEGSGWLESLRELALRFVHQPVTQVTGLFPGSDILSGVKCSAAPITGGVMATRQRWRRAEKKPVRRVVKRAVPPPEVVSDPVESAQAAGLRYVSDTQPGIRRKKAG